MVAPSPFVCARLDLKKKLIDLEELSDALCWYVVEGQASAVALRKRYQTN